VSKAWAMRTADSTEQIHEMVNEACGLALDCLAASVLVWIVGSAAVPVTELLLERPAVVGHLPVGSWPAWPRFAPAQGVAWWGCRPAGWGASVAASMAWDSPRWPEGSEPSVGRTRAAQA